MNTDFEINMVNTYTLTHSDRQIRAWLRGLVTIAYADGHFDPEEQELIANLTQNELIPNTDLGGLEVISPHELAEELGDDLHTKENFLRTAVMMAIANGVYSKAEADKVHEFQEALGLNIEALASLESTLCHLDDNETPNGLKPPKSEGNHEIDMLKPMKKWLDGIDIKDPRVARFVCKMVPPQCPFERDVKLFGKKIVHIPPMCKINPLYEQLVGLRFRSLSFLADECKEDITPYI